MFASFCPSLYGRSGKRPSFNLLEVEEHGSHEILSLQKYSNIPRPWNSISPQILNLRRSNYKLSMEGVCFPWNIIFSSILCGQSQKQYISCINWFNWRMTQNHFASSLKCKNKMWIGVTTASRLYRTNRDWEIGLRPRALFGCYTVEQKINSSKVDSQMC